MSFYEKLKKIEALIERGASPGEREAARQAKARLQERVSEAPVEFTVRNGSTWEKRLFMAVCNKHGLRTYRYYRQKHTTSMLKVKKSYMDEVLWPEYLRYSQLLHEAVDEMMRELIAKVHAGEEEEAVISDKQLPSGVA